MRAHSLEMRFPGTREGFGHAFERLRSALDAHQLDSTARYNTELVFEEIVANLVKHAAPADRELDVRVILESRPDAILLTFEDDGKPFDPREHAAPEQPNLRGEEKVGGFGLKLVRRAASALDYVRTPEGRNRLTVTVPR
jgi:anti-sigma regulatory factor (Ser/Thr protein kinase)